MFADGATVPDGQLVETDVCIVGAGPAGLTIARELSTAGFEVVLLERGSESGRPPSPDTAVNVGTPYDLDKSRSFEVGGAVQRWRVATPFGRGFGRLRELDALDFEVRDWVPNSGWPFGKEELGTFYNRARGLFDVPWPSEEPESLWDQDLHAGPFAAGRDIETRVFSFADPSTFPGPIWRSLKNSERVLALTGTTATELRRDGSNSEVSSIEVGVGRQHRFSVRAKAYVLAAGGIENARLLLVSRDRQPEGLGNDHDLVGRYFMEHPHYASGLLVPGDRGAFDDRSHGDIHLADGIPLQKKYVLRDEIVRREGLLGCTFRFEAKPVTDSYFTLRYSERAERGVAAATAVARAVAERRRPARGGPSIAAAAVGMPYAARHAANRLWVRVARSMGRRRYRDPHLFWIRAMAEQVPNPASRVQLIGEPDGVGVPKVALDWQMTAQDRDSMLRSQELLAATLRRVGHQVESLLDDRVLPPALSGGMHHMGTTRMHASPRKGVVDQDGRVHGVHNVLVAGSSVFPTVGYANPTLTILALALRLGEHLKHALRRS